MNLAPKLCQEIMFRISTLVPRRPDMMSCVKEQIHLLCKKIIKSFVLDILMKWQT